MREIALKLVTETIQTVAYNLIKQAVIYLPVDVKEALRRAYRDETSEIGRTQLENIMANVAKAEEKQAPICQDTGILTFYVEVGTEVTNIHLLEKAFLEATKRATNEVPLRPNAVNPFTSKNSGDNTGRLIPQIHWEIVPGNSLKITVFPKGGGSENVSTLGMLSPSEGIKGLKRFVLNAVVKAGGQPCPPTIVGVGVGGGADLAMTIAKKSLLRPLNQKSVDPEIALLEKELIEAANMTGIGPMGLGGKVTVLGVNIGFAYRHPASFPVAVAFSCWACRRASAKISTDGTVEYLAHKAEGIF